MKIALFVFAALFTWACYYFGQPTLAYGFTGLPIIILFASLIVFAGFSWSPRYQEFDFTSKGAAGRKVSGFFMVVAAIYLIFVTFFSTSSIFRAQDYRALIGDIEESVFTADISPVSNEKIRIVDQPIAAKLGDKTIGEVPALGSQTDFGTYNIQLVTDKLYWVAPLLHSGFLKYWRNSSKGTPGYVKVSATNESDKTLVQEVNGEPITIVYQPGAFFGKNLQRHLYMSGYRSVGKTDYTFEIDDSGYPYWVVTLFDKKVGFSGKDAYGVAVVNAQTGEIAEYSVEDAPKWIDRIQPLDIVQTQLNEWGKWVHGWPNWSDKDRLQTTDGMSLVYSNERAYWYTGITSVGADQGTIGFTLTDTRTKETKLYKQPGATETAAKRSAEGAVQEKEYEATSPITYNVHNIPTFFMTLKDNEGLKKMVAFVSVKEYEIVGIGETKVEALRDYKSALYSRGNSLSPSSTADRFVSESVVTRIDKNISNGDTYYYFMVEGYDNKIFVGTVVNSVELPVTQNGDRVRLVYDDSYNEAIDLVEFDNLEFVLQKTEEQISSDKYFEEVDSLDRNEELIESAESRFENLSDEEKLNMMNRATE